VLQDASLEPTFGRDRYADYRSDLGERPSAVDACGSDLGTDAETAAAARAPCL